MSPVGAIPCGCPNLRQGNHKGLPLPIWTIYLLEVPYQHISIMFDKTNIIQYLDVELSPKGIPEPSLETVFFSLTLCCH